MIERDSYEENIMRIHKYIVFGFGAAFGVAVAATTAIIAAESTTPITFKPGDVISADQLNDQFAKVKSAVEGVNSSADIAGTWSCTEYNSQGGSALDCTGATGWTTDSSGLYSTRTQNVTISSSSNTIAMAVGAPARCAGSSYATTPFTAAFAAANGFVVWNPPYGREMVIVAKTSPSSFKWYGIASNNGASMTCTKQNLSPAIPTGLSSTFASGTVTLSWTNNATDQTGYKVAKKTTLTGAYSDVGTPTTATYSETLTTGTYWYRVRATNANGDSLGSNEVAVTVP